MDEYLIILVGAGALSSLVALLSYGSAFEKWQKFGVSVIILYLILSPLIGFLSQISASDIPDIFDEELPGFSESGLYEQTAKDAFSEGIARLIEEKWDIPREKISIRLTNFHIDEMRAEKIEITLYGRGIGADFRVIEKYLENASLGDCEVKYAFG